MSTLDTDVVSPGFTPRPSLSGVMRRGSAVQRHAGSRVAGVHAPAFVERSRLRNADTIFGELSVSPGFTPRPSLSVRAAR